jgi:DNA-binding transcriptional MerR regulator
MQSNVLKIGEVSRKSGIAIETLRFYERQGLLGKPARTASNYRVYGPEVLERLEFIRRAQVLGLSLSEIAEVIQERESGHSPCGHVRAIVRRRLEELDQRLKEMKQYRKELAAALEQWEKNGDENGRVCGHIEGSRIEHSLPNDRKVGRAIR